MKRLKTSLVLSVLLLTLTTARTQTTKPVTIPLDVTSYGGIFLQARVNNSPPLWFYLDSGATSAFVINQNKAKALKLELQPAVTRSGGAGPNTYEASFTSGVTISLGPKIFTGQTAAVFSLDLVEEQLGRSVDGLVGIDLFLDHVVEIDYAEKKLWIYDPDQFTYSGKGESIPHSLRGGHFFVGGRIDFPERGELTGQYLVDTGGCMMSAILTTSFAQQNRLSSISQKRIVDRSVSGLGGVTSLLVSRANHFKIGSADFPSPLIYISQDKAGALASSEYQGLLGTEILKRFKLMFDYSHRRLILERNSNFAEPLEYDMSGMSVRAYGYGFKTFKIYQVLEDSPAATANLHAGDIIERIDKLEATQLTLEQILQMMKVANREYEVGIKRDNKTLVVKLKTKRLI